MAGLGTVINVAGILAGGLSGLLFGKFMTQRYQDTLTMACGVTVMFIGIAGTIEKMMAVTGKSLTSGGTMMIIGSFMMGSLLGEWLNIEHKLEEFGRWLKARTGSSGDKMFVDGFVTASLTVCIGAMAVVGSIQDGIYGDCSILAAKAALDLIIVLVMTASMGKGCLFSAIPVDLSGGRYFFIRAHRAVYDRNRLEQSVSHRFHADLLRGSESDMGQKDKRGQYASHTFDLYDVGDRVTTGKSRRN